MTLLDHPLPIAFLIYITLCSIIIYVKPRILFTTTTTSTPKPASRSNTDTDTITNEIIAHKTIWLFFILLAILVYSLVSIFISHTNRNNFLLQLK
jgi:hypothetical protein